MLGQVHHFVKYNKGKAPYAEERYLKEAHRLYGVLDRRLTQHEFVADDYSIADIAIWPWYGGLALGRNYPGANEFLATHEYEHVMRWAKAIDARTAVKRGRIVNKMSGDPAEQLHERHDASDFELRTLEKLEAAAA